MFAERLNVLYEKNWTKLVTEQLKKFEKSVVESAKQDDSLNIDSSKWTFGGSLLYTVTLLTTVGKPPTTNTLHCIYSIFFHAEGYGKLSPKTTVGKIVAILYATVGVPLMLILLSELGSVLALGVRRGYSKLCCHKNQEGYSCPTVGYHKAPTTPTKNFYQKTVEGELIG